MKLTWFYNSLHLVLRYLSGKGTKLFFCLYIFTRLTLITKLRLFEFNSVQSVKINSPLGRRTESKMCVNASSVISAPKVRGKMGLFSEL